MLYLLYHVPERLYDRPGIAWRVKKRGGGGRREGMHRTCFCQGWYRLLIVIAVVIVEREGKAERYVMRV